MQQFLLRPSWVGVVAAFVTVVAVARDVGFARKVYLPLDGNARDYCRGVTGTVTGATANTVDQWGNAAFTFDGQNDQITFAHATEMTIGSTGQLSVVAYVKVNEFNTDTSTQSRAPVVARGSHNLWEWALYVYDDARVGLNVWVCAGTGADSVEVAGGTIVRGAWTHLAGTYDSTTRRATIYMNGAQIAGGTMPSGNTHCTASGISSNPLYIGARSDGQFLSAVIDDVAIYNSALSQTEIRSLQDLPQSGGCTADFEAIEAGRTNAPVAFAPTPLPATPSPPTTSTTSSSSSSSSESTPPPDTPSPGGSSSAGIIVGVIFAVLIVCAVCIALAVKKKDDGDGGFDN